MDSSEDVDVKLKKITESLWVPFWFVIYIILLPASISGIVYIFTSPFGPQLIQGSFEWLDELSFSSLFITLILVIPLLYYPYDKYRSKKFFVRKKAEKKHIFIYFVASVFPVLYYNVLNLIFRSMGKHFDIFFSENVLFLRIIHPIFSFFGIIF